MKVRRVLAALVCAMVAIALAVGACGAGEESDLATTTAGPVPTGAGAATGTAGPATTGAETGIDEALLGVWVSDQGIQLEFTADGVVTLVYEGSQAQSLYSATDGKVSYTDFEPNEEGVLPLVEVPYVIDGDTLLWDVGGGGELTLTRE